jgi:hypothetical protein
MYLWIAMCMGALLAHVAFEISDHSPNFLDTPRIIEFTVDLCRHYSITSPEKAHLYTEMDRIIITDLSPS